MDSLSRSVPRWIARYGLFLAAWFLVWPLSVPPARGASRPFAWGDNQLGELGIGVSGATAYSNRPTPVIGYSSLAGKSVVANAAGGGIGLALASDGTLSSWGFNYYGQLGNGTEWNSGFPTAVYTGGVLAGKTIQAIAAGGGFSLVLAADGTLYAWGSNQNGTLGNGSNMDSSVPVAVYMGGALAGKTVKAIAAGGGHCLALTTDGVVYSWGYNSNGQLGVGITGGNSSVPLAVITTGTPMAGKFIVGIAAGGYHSLALASDGTVYAWGWDLDGQLGNGVSGSVGNNLPVAVTTAGTPMAGRTISSITAGSLHSLALASDGSIYSWGSNGVGQLGNGAGGSNSLSSVPVAVSTVGTPMAGKNITAISAGALHNLALASDGSVYSWGSNTAGQLGNGTGGDGTSSHDSYVPVSVDLPGGTATGIAAGNNYSLALVSGGPGWQAVDVAVGSDNKTRLLWVNASGQVVVWSVDNAGTVSSGPIYGPYPGWTPRALAAGSDGVTRILWNHLDGTAALWIVDANNNYVASYGYGPYLNWTAMDITVAVDGRARILWTNTNTVWTLWSVDNNGATTYGPGYAADQWTAQAVSAGPDGLTRVLWNNTDASAAFWLMNGDNSYLASSDGYGPFTGWLPMDTAVGSDNKARLLWSFLNNRGSIGGSNFTADARMIVWSVDNTGKYTFGPIYGPYPGFIANHIAAGGDNLTRVLWNRNDGTIVLWLMGADNTLQNSFTFGPY